MSSKIFIYFRVAKLQGSGAYRNNHPTGKWSLNHLSTKKNNFRGAFFGLKKNEFLVYPNYMSIYEEEKNLHKIASSASS